MIARCSCDIEAHTAVLDRRSWRYVRRAGGPRWCSEQRSRSFARDPRSRNPSFVTALSARMLEHALSPSRCVVAIGQGFDRVIGP
jgi:hypothetical protein